MYGRTTVGMPFPGALVGLDSIVGTVLMNTFLNVNRIPDFLEESVKAAPPHAHTTASRIMPSREGFDWTEIRYHPFCACIWQFLARGFRPDEGPVRFEVGAETA